MDHNSIEYLRIYNLKFGKDCKDLNELQNELQYVVFITRKSDLFEIKEYDDDYAEYSYIFPIYFNDLFIKMFKVHNRNSLLDLNKYRKKIEDENKHPDSIIQLRNELRKNYDTYLNKLERYLISEYKINENDYKNILSELIKDDNKDGADFRNYLKELKSKEKFKTLNEYLKSYFKFIFQ
jgi:hypothetical protein